VKISKKNVCLVTIVKGDDAEKQEDERQRLLEFYLSQKDPTWGQQFKNAVMLGPQIDEDNLVLEDVEAFDAFSHFLTIFWKVAFATVPPTGVWGGKAAFLVSLAYIGAVTAVVGQIAELFGCVVGIDESVTAITLVALGTSLPDTFASMTAARSSEYADSAIGNVTGSNSVNVFLGLGLPWAAAATYWASAHEGKLYQVPAGAVAFSVFVFLIVAVCCFMILIARRVVSNILIFVFYHNFYIGYWWRAWRTTRQ
jgi:solute carrier family 8 (sodium/calcium exchanger)